MNLTTFRESVVTDKFPAGASVYLQALWHDAKGDWEKAHLLIQDVPDKRASWIHAYLHRQEGDIRNADYWYSKAGKTRPERTLREEWEALASAFCKGI